jgi:hypothetical protein
MSTAAIVAAAVSSVMSLSITPPSAQGPVASESQLTATLNTPWGEPDLQGIWTDETETPLQRAPKYASQEFFTEAQRQELDKERSALLGRDRRVERGTELDVAGAYNAQFMSRKRTGLRTSLIVDPPNGRVPSLTPQAQKIAVADREFRLALLQSTETCKNKSVACGGGKYDPAPSPRRAELPPRYNTIRMNRHDSPEDGALPDRCLTGGLPEFGGPTGSFRRIVQTPGGVSMFYDVGQGQGWQRNIVMRKYPPVVWRLARPLGRKYAGRRCDQLQSEDRFSGLAREPAPRRALDPDLADLARICRDDRRPERVDAAVDRQAGVHEAERRGEQTLYRAALHRRELWASRPDAGSARGGTRLCGGTRS